MSELIDRQLLVSHLNECLAESDGKTPITDAVLTAIKCAVEQMPTVDAVPVIRCEDCKHWDNENDIGWCNIHSNFADVDWTMFDADDFCSAGKRREDKT